jgi:DNA replication protein DnaC
MMLDLTPDLVRRLKRLRLGGLLPTLPDRVTHARQGKLSHVEFLELLLQDEIDRRDSHDLSLRLEQAGFEETATFEQIVVSFDRARVRELFSLHWLAQQENVIFCGPVGVGKTFLACALGHRATILTSNRAVDEWVALFDDPILANSAPDRFAHRAHQIVMEGPSVRAASAPSPPKGKRRTSESAASRG